MAFKTSHSHLKSKLPLNHTSNFPLMFTFFLCSLSKILIYSIIVTQNFKTNCNQPKTKHLLIQHRKFDSKSLIPYRSKSHVIPNRKLISIWNSKPNLSQPVLNVLTNFLSSSTFSIFLFRCRFVFWLKFREVFESFRVCLNLMKFLRAHKNVSRKF
jgi:hypothetical protein